VAITGRDEGVVILGETPYLGEGGEVLHLQVAEVGDVDLGTVVELPICDEDGGRGIGSIGDRLAVGEKLE
jgi:hypothetical protein